MTSGKQRRAEIMAARLHRAEKRKQALRASAFAGAGRLVAVDPSKLAPDNSYGVPDFVARGYYRDVLFRCADCGAPGVWSAERQKWWYEVAGGYVWSTARRCAACRARKREQRDLGRKTYFEGMARKASLG